MKKILLPTDFSDNAYNAIEYAVHLFKDEKCIFFLLNTYTPVIFDNEYVFYNSNIPSLDEIHRKDSLANLQKIIKKINKNYPNEHHSFRKIASFNLLTEEIKDQVVKENIDLIVMGTQGATGAKQLLFGSQTVHVIRTAGCPVLAIPSFFYYEEPKNILLPTDFGLEPTEHDLRLIREIATRYHTQIQVLHVLKEQNLSDEQEEIKKKFNKELKGTKHKLHILRQKEIPQAIYDFQEENSIDMLVMINNKHSFFENLFFRPLVHKIGFHTKIPFLVIPSRKGMDSKKK